MSKEQSYVTRRRGASNGAGWGIRIVEGDGTAWLNSLSGGDVLVYDSEEDAKADAVESREQAQRLAEFSPQYRARKYFVVRVDPGAWSPSAYDAALIELMAFAMPEAQRGVFSAVRAVNRGRALLSHYAPAHLREPLHVQIDPGSKEHG